MNHETGLQLKPDNTITIIYFVIPFPEAQDLKTRNHNSITLSYIDTKK